MNARTLAFASVLLGWACSSSSTTPASDAGGADAGSARLEADHYDQSCALDADCVIVNEAPCDPCAGEAFPPSCSGTAAIAVKDKPRYGTDFAAAKASCPKKDPVACPALCLQITAICRGGTCSTCSGQACATDAGHD